MRPRIAARPETVFAYFTEAGKYRLWQGVDAELDARPGGVFRVTMTGRTRTVARGVFLEVEPPHRVVYTWGWEPLDGQPDGMRGLLPGTSTVEIILSADGEGTLLRVRHSGLATLARYEFHTWGWNLTLDRLVVVASGDDPGPTPLADL